MPSVLNTAVTQGAGFNQVMGAVRDVYSAEIFFSALPIMKFDQFTTKKTELGVQRGRTIQMPRYGNLKRGGRLIEGRRLKAQPMSMTQEAITVDEWGNAIGFSELLLQTAFFDQMSAASILLGRDLAIVLDLGIRDAVLSANNVVYANNKASRSALTSTDTFSASLVDDGVEILETANAAKWAGDHWICFVHPHQARGFRDDQKWVQAALYSGANQIYTGEIGRYNDTRFVSTTVMPNGANGAVDPVTGDYVDIGFDPELQAGYEGNQTTIYQAVMFGEWSIGHATALPVQLRDDGVTDYGREHGLAWYAIYGQDILEQSNIVILETA